MASPGISAMVDGWFCQVLINAVIFHVGINRRFPGFPTNQALEMHLGIVLHLDPKIQCVAQLPLLCSCPIMEITGREKNPRF